MVHLSISLILGFVGLGRNDHCEQLPLDPKYLTRVTTKSSEFQHQGHSVVMASTSTCAGHLKDVDSSHSPTMGSGGSENLTAPRPATEQATASSSASFASGTESKMTQSGKCHSSVEEQIEHSKCHWSQLSKPDSKKSFKCFHCLPACFGRGGPSSDEDEAAEFDNREVFKTLQLHPTWGPFFQTFGYDTEHCLSAGSLEVGEKFAEGAQAELFHARVTWKSSKMNEYDLKEGIQWVLKVFKKGTLLRHLLSQWPHGYLQWLAKELTGDPRFRYEVFCATLLEDGRFAFLKKREDEDLRSLIDCNRLENGHGYGPPFSKEKGEELMYRVALGMDWLHRNNIVHRDLKASNVLVNKLPTGSHGCSVADFECLIGVVGTGFWRALEILQACKDKVVNQREDLFTRHGDVYSYGMTCYEVLTEKLPFEHHPLSDNHPLLLDLVINGLRPELPDFVDAWAHDLLRRCWESNPTTRPSFQEILNLLEVNSNVIYIKIWAAKRVKADEV